VTDLLQDIGERVKALGADWTKYSVIGSFLLYVVGYLALRFHLMALGISTDLAVLDERYLFTGARFVVYLVSAVPNILLVGLVVWAASRVIPARIRRGVLARTVQPARLAIFGIVFAVVAIQFVMRQCFLFSDLLLAPNLQSRPGWLVSLLLHDEFMPLYFSALVVMAAIPLAILAESRDADPREVGPWTKGLLAFLAAVLLLLLPVNYGMLVVDKTMPRVAAVGDKPVAPGEDAWLVWEGKDGVTYLMRSSGAHRRSLITLPRTDVKRTEVVGFDHILPTLFGAAQGGE
jgi:hypothetical protein